MCLIFWIFIMKSLKYSALWVNTVAQKTFDAFTCSCHVTLALLMRSHRLALIKGLII